jgi:Mg2+ and Co2+ transporter CorA
MSVRLLVFTNLCRHMSNMRLVLVLMAVELTITDQEEKALSDPSRETIQYLSMLSRQLIVFRRHFWRVRDAVNFQIHMERDQKEGKIYSDGI